MLGNSLQASNAFRAVNLRRALMRRQLLPEADRWVCKPTTGASVSGKGRRGCWMRNHSIIPFLGL